jgi:glycosyltransferase involved in cell wall biosynthesis
LVISTIIPTRNRAKKLKRVLDALLGVDYGFTEIIVCDGASTDGTVALLKSYGDRIRWSSEPDGGEYEARNKGLLMATGEIIKYMSDDDVPLPESFSYAAKFFEENPDVQLLFGQAIWFDERGGGPPVVCDTRRRTQASIKLRNFIRASGPLPRSEAVFFRRQIIQTIGLFDTSKHGADYDFWARAAKSGLSMHMCDKVFVHYHLSDLSGVERKNLPMLFEFWGLARKYGVWTDRLFVACCLIPWRLVVYALINYVPIAGVPLRTAWGKWKSRVPLE